LGKVTLTVASCFWAKSACAAATQQAVAQVPVVKPVRNGAGDSALSGHMIC
jgi:hypothetical protein